MSEPMMTLIGQVASTGIVGIFLALALLALREKDKALLIEKNARIEDSQKYMTLAMALQKDVITAVKTLGEIVEKWEKREEDRERLDRELELRNARSVRVEGPPEPHRPPGGPSR